VLLYNSAVSGNCYQVRLLLAHLGLEYETVEMSVVDRSNRAEFSAT
jgi:glutathione S-transferase